MGHTGSPEISAIHPLPVRCSVACVGCQEYFDLGQLINCQRVGVDGIYTHMYIALEK